MLGPVRGCAVRLARASDALVIAEGIETALSVMQATGTAAWAALSATGLRLIELPTMVRTVTIAADHDHNREGMKAAEALAARLLVERRHVTIARPPRAGLDFNDVLRGAAA
jgi:phage/plasmid primase-like uncharacterized protein